MTSFPFTGRRLVLPLAVASVIACHHAPSPAVAGPELEGVIGDSSTFGARIVQLDRAQQRVTYQLAKPAFVVLLSVSPGRSIDPVWVDSSTTPSMVDPRKHTVGLRTPGVAGAFGRDGLTPRDVLPASVQAEIDRCVRQAIAAAERQRAQNRKRRVVRDSTGRVVRVEEGQASAPRASDVSNERNAEAACYRRYANRPGATTPDTHERYLLILASNTSLNAIELVSRLNALTVTALDAPGTIAAVAEGLYFDRHAIWSGHYVRW